MLLPLVLLLWSWLRHVWAAGEAELCFCSAF
jgi:hypothetical protein